jgi:hypothetical protein
MKFDEMTKKDTMGSPADAVQQPEPDEATKVAVGALVNAVQQSVEQSQIVKSAVANLEYLGYIPNFTVKMDLELNRPIIAQLTDTRIRHAS